MPIEVLISSPTHGESVYLPYIFGVLKTHFDRNAADASRVHWLDPIYLDSDAERLSADPSRLRIDVLGLSCYTWNWQTQCRLGASVKRAYPDCKVVLGGPQPDWRDEALFRHLPFVDAVVRQDGEIPFTAILERVIVGNDDWHDVPGLFLPDRRRNRFATGAPSMLDRRTDFAQSPYCAQDPVFRRILKRIRGLRMPASAVIETNRGCPYRCTFCDWGSSTHSKVRRFDNSRVAAEVAWLAENRIEFVFIADANFGMFEDDERTAEHFAGQRLRVGFPKAVHYSPTKSKATRLVGISRTLFDAGTTTFGCLSLQHTRQSVLDAIDRKNLDHREIGALIEHYNAARIPMYVQLILGCPGDDYRLWQSCLCDLMEWSVHETYHVFPFAVLPNAPAASADYGRRWRLQTVASEGAHAGTSASRYVTASATFSSSEWCRMWVFTHFVTVLHNMGLARQLAIYLRRIHNVAYVEFYRAVVDELGRRDGIVGQAADYLLHRYRAFVEGRDPRVVEQRWDRWLLARLTTCSARFYDELDAYLAARFPSGDRELRADLLQYQQRMMIDYHYDPEAGRSIRTTCDWPNWLACAATKDPPPLCPGTVRIRQTAIGVFQDEPITWHRQRGRQRIAGWLHQVSGAILQAGRTYFVQPEFVPDSVLRVERGARRSA